MISIKRNLSIGLNQAFEQSLKNYRKIIRVEKNKDFLMVIKDLDDDSSFYFGIQRESYDSSGHFIHFSSNPRENGMPTSYSASATINNFKTILQNWLNYLEHYNKDSILDDLILNRYREEFYEEFKIVDEDADYVSFTYDQQLLLNTFLTNVVENINIVKNETNASLIEEILEDTRTLQSNITTETKNSFMKKLSTILGKGQKAGLTVSDFLIKELGKVVAKNIAEWCFNFGTKHMSELPSYIKHMAGYLLPG